jgi:hypothetical protein
MWTRIPGPGNQPAARGSYAGGLFDRASESRSRPRHHHPSRGRFRARTERPSIPGVCCRQPSRPSGPGHARSDDNWKCRHLRWASSDDRGASRRRESDDFAVLSPDLDHVRRHGHGTIGFANIFVVDKMAVISLGPVLAGSTRADHGRANDTLFPMPAPGIMRIPVGLFPMAWSTPEIVWRTKFAMRRVAHFRHEHVLEL